MLKFLCTQARDGELSAFFYFCKKGDESSLKNKIKHSLGCSYVRERVNKLNGNKF